MELKALALWLLECFERYARRYERRYTVRHVRRDER
jgi:hypothetical protein